MIEVFSEQDVRRALWRMTTLIEALLRPFKRPVMVPVMAGGAWTAHEIGRALDLPLRDRIAVAPAHARAYIEPGVETDVRVAMPDLAGYDVAIIIDDYADTGRTLEAVVGMAATQVPVVLSAALVLASDCAFGPDVFGLEYTGELWLHGCGMDAGDGSGRFTPSILGVPRG